MSLTQGSWALPLILIMEDYTSSETLDNGEIYGILDHKRDSRNYTRVVGQEEGWPTQFRCGILE